MKHMNEEYKCTTVGELKALLADTPDDWLLVTTHKDDDGDNQASSITHVNTYWHGAITFEHTY
jgi:hypothetical protein